MNPSAIVINTIIEKILPWYKVEFINVGILTAELRISKVLMHASLVKNGVTYLALALEDVSEQDVHLVDHLNGILSGMVRNDAGELIAPGAEQ